MNLARLPFLILLISTLALLYQSQITLLLCLIMSIYNIYFKTDQFHVKLYCFVLVVIFIVPNLLKFFGVFHPITSILIPQTICFTYYFLIVAFLIFNFFIKKNSKYNLSNLLLSVKSFGLIKTSNAVMFLFVLSIFSKLYLDFFGAFRMLGDVQAIGGLQLLKVFSKYDVFCIIYFLIVRNKKRNVLLLFCMIIISLFWALYSGSRFQLGIILLSLFFYFSYVRNLSLTKTLISFIPIVIIYLSFFPAISKYRNSDTTDLNYIIKNHEGVSDESILDVVSTRLNYFDIVAVSIQNSTDIDREPLKYFDNIIGFIPRFLWPSKPNIGVDYNYVGKRLKIISANDYKTSVGLSVFGEAYYLCGPIFSFFIVVVFSIMFNFFSISKDFKNHPLILSFYFMLTVFLIEKDGLIGFLPGLVTFIIPFYLLLKLKSD